VATTSAGTVRPVDRRTLTVPELATTWLLVSTRPSAASTTPEPSEEARLLSTRTVTTLG
jgi:hypothetical protein